jgi:hypothetical protein
LALLAEVTIQSRRPEKSVREVPPLGCQKMVIRPRILSERRVADSGDKVSEFVMPLSHHIFVVVGAPAGEAV